MLWLCLFVCKHRTAYERRISDWSSDVWSSDLLEVRQDEIRSRIQEIEAQFGDNPYTPEVETEVGDLDGEFERNEGHLRQLDERRARLQRVEIGRAQCRASTCKYV